MRQYGAALFGIGIAVGLPACAAAPDQAGQAARADLIQARQAVASHDAQGAIGALDAAESAWLTATASQPNPVVHHQHLTVHSIGTARAAVRQGAWGDAAHSIASALRDMAGTVAAD